MEQIAIKRLKKGDFFTLKEIEDPKESQVWIKGEWDRSEHKYVCTRFDDISESRLIKATKPVYTGFTF